MFGGKLILLACGLMSIPGVVSASVTITEIAWMGSAESANHEWIELYNSGSAIDVTGWRLYDESRIDVELVGTIPAGAYAVLERTSDASAPGTAWLTYTGALTNAGATLTVKDSTGTVIDQVRGGENWEQVGGDNGTKATAQRRNDTWVTAPATPGSATVADSTPSVDVTDDISDESDTTPTAEPKSNNGEPIILTLPGVTLQLDIVGPTQAQVNQPVEFTVTPSGVGNTIADSLQYTWNFGDTHTATGLDVTHRFAHPGQYVVTVEGRYKRQHQVTRMIIEVVAPQVVLTAEDEYVLLTNQSDREVLLDGYILSGTKSVTLPQHTIVLANQSLRIPVDFVGDPDTTMFVLHDQAAVVQAILLPTGLSAQVAPPELALVDSPKPRDVPVYEPVTTSYPTVSQSYVPAVTPVVDPVPLTASPVAIQPDLSAVEQTTNNWPLYALVALLLAGIGAVYFTPRARPVADVPPFIQ